MKKNWFMRIALIVLSLTVMTTCLISGTFAKYTSTVTGTGTATVAKWAVAFKHDTEAKTADYSFNLTDTSANTANVLAGKVAPGSEGSFKVTIDGTGSEVAFEYLIELTTTNVTFIKFYSDAAMTTEWANATGNTKVALANVATAIETTIYWKWVATNDTDDTTVGIAAGSKTFTVKLTASQTIETTPIA